MRLVPVFGIIFVLYPNCMVWSRTENSRIKKRVITQNTLRNRGEIRVGFDCDSAVGFDCDSAVGFDCDSAVGFEYDREDEPDCYGRQDQCFKKAGDR